MSLLECVQQKRLLKINNMETNKIILNSENKELELIDETNIFVELSNAELSLKLAYFSKVETLNINCDLNENSKLNVTFVDYSNGSLNADVKVNLNGIGATSDWKLASLATSSFEKKYDISFIHNKENTTAIMNNYGVSKDTANIIFTGVNHIKEYCPKFVTRQNAKIILFDEYSKGTASPVLKIDENDVVASHGAVVGQISDEHMFYLMSRGLTKKEARALIILGYISPFTIHFSESTKERISNAIKEVI